MAYLDVEPMIRSRSSLAQVTERVRAHGIAAFDFGSAVICAHLMAEAEGNGATPVFAMLAQPFDTAAVVATLAASHPKLG